jgi:Fe-S cluster assembly iron-binding protein IscA
MLTLTDTASTAVKTIAARALGQDADGGLRISSTSEDGYAVAIATAPESTDVVVENHGAQVFLEKEASDALTDKVLDAQLDTDGSVSFAIANRA